MPRLLTIILLSLAAWAFVGLIILGAAAYALYTVGALMGAR